MRYIFAVRDIETKSEIMTYEYNNLSMSPTAYTIALAMLFDDIDRIANPYLFEYSLLGVFPKDGEHAKQIRRGSEWQQWPENFHRSPL